MNANGWTIERKITLGIVLQIVLYVVLIVAGYVVLGQTVAQNQTAIEANTKRIEANTERISSILDKMEASYVPRRELDLIIKNQDDLKMEIRELRASVREMLKRSR